MQAELLPDVVKGASLSEDGVYRYRLTRTWAVGEPSCVWIMLNPSTADADVDDPTIRRCMGFARLWGYEGIVVVNLFALRATDPNALDRHHNPIGPDNDAYVHDAIIDHRMTVAAWGAHPLAVAKGKRWAEIARRSGTNLWCLGTTKDGAPRHPLYVKGDQALVRWPSEPTPGLGHHDSNGADPLASDATGTDAFRQPVVFGPES